MNHLYSTIKAVIYARVSTHDQARHGYSLESQIEKSRSFAMARFGFHENELLAYVEEGEMGDDPNRPALNGALRLIEQGVGRKFIVLHPDRLARDLKLQLFVTERIWNAGCDVAFVEMDIDPNNPESMLLYNIQGAISQYNKAKILANSKRGRRTKVRNGQIPGNRRIYGYSFDKTLDILVENPEERQVYLRMVDWLLRGKDGKPMNLSAIARELSLLGIPAPCGNKWYQATVSRILRNPAYTGTFYYGKTEHIQKAGKKIVVKKPRHEWYEIPIPAFIDAQTYDAVIHVLDGSRRSQSGVKPKAMYLVKGLVRCGECGRAMVAGAPSRRKATGEIIHRYYVCSGKAKKAYHVGSGRPSSGCSGANWRQDVVDDVVWGFIVESVFRATGYLENLLCTTQSEREQRWTHQRREYEEALKKKAAERMNWLQLRARGRVTDDQLDEVLAPIDSEIEALTQHLERVTQSQKSFAWSTTSTTRTESIEALLSYIQGSITLAEKRRFVQQMIGKVLLNDNGEISVVPKWKGDNCRDVGMLS